MDFFKIQFLDAGVPAAKLGLGLAFYGWKWNGGVLASDPSQGISGPLQLWRSGSAPTIIARNYNTITPLLTSGISFWDASAVVPYISYTGIKSADYWYLTYDNPESIQAKVQYIISSNLGGWIIWALDQDYFPNTARPHPLLDAVQVGSVPMVISTPALGNGVVGSFYNASLSATGAAPFHWGLLNGSLPPGLSLSSAGVISGTPTSTGISAFLVSVGNFAGSSSRSFTITITAPNQ